MKKIAMVVPALNEAESLDSVLAHLSIIQPKLIIVLGNQFGQAPSQFGQSNVRFFEERVKTGNGFLVRWGFKLALESGADYIIKIDGDGQHAPEVVPEVITCLEQGQPFVLASRYHPKSKIGFPPPPVDRLILNQLFTRQINAMTGWHLTDALSGFWGISRQVLSQILPSLTVEGYGLGFELLLGLFQLGYSVNETPHPQIYSGTKKLDTIYQGQHLSLRADRARIYLEVVSRTLEKMKDGWPLVTRKAPLVEKSRDQEIRLCA